MARPRYLPGTTFSYTLRRPLGKRRVLDYLAARLHAPASWIVPLLEEGAGRVDGVPFGPETWLDLRPGMTIEIDFPNGWPPHLRPVPMPLSILYEDSELLVVDKPAGIVVHPARGHMSGTSIQNSVFARYYHEIERKDASLAAPHRLDRDTSGILLFARTRRAYRELARQFARGEVEKEYLAIVDGEPSFSSTTVEIAIGVDPMRPCRCAVLDSQEGGKIARTDLEVLESGKGWALLRAKPRTGRPHQIRIHCHAIGVPIFGDIDYHPFGAEHRRRWNFPRHALHASRIVFRHPTTTNRMCVESPLPEDLRLFFDRIRQDPSLFEQTKEGGDCSQIENHSNLSWASSEAEDILFSAHA